MCMMLHIAADRPPPRIAWDDDAPAFHVGELQPYDEAVRAQFTKAHIASLGSHQGCGCGFAYPKWPAEEDPVEWAARRDSMGRLADYLARIDGDGEVELYSWWTGDEAAEPEHRGVATPDDFRDESFVFLTKQWLKVVPTTGAVPT